MFRLHVIGLPHTRTRADYTPCAFTQKVLKFCKMMHRRGHTVFHYGTEGSDPECTENVPVVSNELFDRVYGHVPKHGPYELGRDNDVYPVFIGNTIDAIGSRKQPGDIILPFWGLGVKEVCDAHPDLVTIEPGIGYPEAFADYRVYESYAWMHCLMADYNKPEWYHTVIPNYFDLEDFTFNCDYDSRMKDPYFLYLGRIFENKGVDIAMQTCEKMGVRLVMAGAIWDGKYDTLPDWVEYVGTAGVEKRRELMRGAVASFVPSYYSEPFGGVTIENFLSGTPVLSTDWGAFPEINVHGVTGYRCRTFDDFVTGALDCLEGKISYRRCREWGERYSLDAIAPMYEKFFRDVCAAHSGYGWYSLYDKQDKL